MSNYIKNLVKGEGWKEVKAIFNKAIQDCHNNHVDEGLDAEQFKINVLANRKAAETIGKIIKEINLKGHEISKEQISYK